MPESVEQTTVTIWSNGVSLNADLHRPKDLAKGQRVPAVVLSHGGRAHEILQLAAAAPVAYRIIDGIDHYGIHFDGYEESSDAARDWFNRYL